MPCEISVSMMTFAPCLIGGVDKSQKEQGCWSQTESLIYFTHVYIFTIKLEIQKKILLYAAVRQVN